MIHNIRAFIRFATGYIQSTKNASFQGSLLKLHKEANTTFAPKTYSNDEQCDQIGRFIGLWATFQSICQQLICPNIPHS